MKNKEQSTPFVFFLFLLFLCVAWTLVAGKDLNFDFRNYHLYSVYAFLNDRLGQDYFPAAVSGYLNPFAEIPVYWMIKHEWDDRVIALALMLMHFPNLLIIWKISQQVIPRSKEKNFFCALATLLAFVAPLQLTTLGNTFSDPTAGTFTLTGVYFLIRSLSSAQYRTALICGLFLGAGAGLKLTNLFFVPPALLVAIFSNLGRPEKIKILVSLALGSAFSFLLVNGWWSWKIYSIFGNPIFPLYNSLFHSPDFIFSDFSDKRMLIYGAWTWAMLPLIMLKSGSMLYSENSVPDIRLMLLVAIWLGIAASKLVLVFRRKAPPHIGSVVAADESSRNLGMLSIYFLVSYVVWGSISGIGRYGYVLWLLIGPICVGALAVHSTKEVARIVTTLALVVQIAVQFLNGNPSYSAYNWSGKWLELEVPQELQKQPATYLIHGVQSNSFIAPYLHPDSRFSNIIGQYVQPAGNAMTKRLRNFLDSSTGPVKVMFETVYTETAGPPFLDSAVEPEMNALLSGYGFKMKGLSCSLILMRGSDLKKSAEKGLEWAKPFPAAEGASPISTVIWACDLEKMSDSEYRDTLRKYDEIDEIFDAVEKKCGAALSPHQIQTVRTGQGWFRNYFNTITILGAREDEIYIHPLTSILNFPVGKVSTWNTDKDNFSCPDIVDKVRSVQINIAPSENSEQR